MSCEWRTGYPTSMSWGVLDRVRFTGTWVSRAVRVAGHERHVALQGVRCTIAAVVAWLVVAEWFHFQQGFLAPYVAVFLVEATVLRSVQQAAVQLGAVVAGLLLAVVVTRLTGSSTVAIGLAVALGYVIGQWRRFGSSGIWVAITALLVIATGASDSPVLLGERLLETMIGVAVGVAVTALIFPPVYSAGEEAAELMTELRDLLRDMATGCRDGRSGDQGVWVRRARGIDRMLQRAYDESRWAHESIRLNPRPAASRIGARVRRWDRTVDNLSSVSSAVEELAHALEPIVDDLPDTDLSEPDSERIRRTVGSVLDALATMVDAESRGEPADPECRRQLSELELVLREGRSPEVTARLGAVLHTSRRMVAALEA